MQPFGGRGSVRRGRGSFGSDVPRINSTPDFDNASATNQTQQTFGGRGGLRVGRSSFGGGRGNFGSDVSQINSTFDHDHTSTTNDQTEQTFRGRGGFRGGRGSFGSAASRPSSNSDLDHTSTTNEQQQQTIRGRGGFCGGRGSFGSDGSLTTDPSATNDQQQLGFGGRGGVRGGRGIIGSAVHRINSTSDLNHTSTTNDQAGQTFRGRGGFRGGRGSFGSAGSRTSSSSDLNYASATNERQQTSRGRGAARGGRASNRGYFGSGANSVQPLSPISREKRHEKNNSGNDFDRRQRPRSQTNSNASDEEFGRRRPFTRYIPVDKPIEEIYAEDYETKEKYIDVTDNDDHVEISGTGNIIMEVIFEKWCELNLNPILYENIKRSEYIRPRKIQSYVIPCIISGRDLKGHSETGSGKTAAFAIPIIQKILSSSDYKRLLPGPTPFAVIIEPTRELCRQVYDQFRKFANNTFIRVCKIYGETNMNVSLREIERGCDILIGTPGRIKHFILTKFVDISKMIFFVLDEADHMLNTNFLDDIRALFEFSLFPPKSRRQSLLFSATFPPEIQQLATDLLRDEFIVVSNKKPVSPNSKIMQSFFQVQSNKKKDFLLELMGKELNSVGEKKNAKLRRVLVFVETRRDSDVLANYLVLNEIKALAINGNRSQFEREEALRKFDKGEIDVLIATDVLARGIDIKNLNHVINFDLPKDDVTYVHRIGRTGRLDTGYATSFVDTDVDAALLPSLVEFILQSGNELPPFMDLKKSEFVSNDDKLQDENNNVLNDDW